MCGTRASHMCAHIETAYITWQWGNYMSVSGLVEDARHTLVNKLYAKVFG